MLTIVLERARVKHLRLSIVDLNVKLTLPGGATDLEAMSFLKKSQHWLKDAAALIASQNKLKDRLEQSPGQTISIWHEEITTDATPRKFMRRIESMIIQRVHSTTENIVLKTGWPEKVVVRRARTQWGCLTSSRKIHLNPAIAFVPAQVCDYVIIHEFAHLVYPNHRRSFWALVRKFMPDYKFAEQWLKENFGLLSHTYHAWGRWQANEW